MRLSNLADYAVVLLCAAARAGEARINATCLAAETGVPLPTAQKLIGKLSGAGLLVSARGGNGGFRLARAPQDITLADIVEAVEGPIALTACVEAGRQDCGLDHHCQVRPHWDVVNEAMRGALASVTLAALSSPLPLALSSSAVPPALPETAGGSFTSKGAGGGQAASAKLATARPTPNPSRTREGNIMVERV